MKAHRNFISILGIIASALPLTYSSAFAKIKPQEARVQNVEMSPTKGINGEATLTVKQQISLPNNASSLPFQNGKIAEEIEFYHSPRCYLHFRNKDGNKDLAGGQIIRIKKIDNVYAKGSVHVTFWFDEDTSVSDLLCITNYNHTLTAAELKATLGTAFHISLSKSVETDALFNTAPNRHAPVLSEGTPLNTSPHAARVILSDS